MTVSTMPTQVVDALGRIRIENHDYDFDCQKWVESALSNFKNTGQLTREDYERRLDGMADAIAEAEDVEE